MNAVSRTAALSGGVAIIFAAAAAAPTVCSEVFSLVVAMTSSVLVVSAWHLGHQRHCIPTKQI